MRVSPAFCQLVADAMQNSMIRSGTASPSAIISGVGRLAISATAPRSGSADRAARSSSGARPHQ
jgi:hypothetical protein